jgi:hypothetical protein
MFAKLNNEQAASPHEVELAIKRRVWFLANPAEHTSGDKSSDAKASQA